MTGEMLASILLTHHNLAFFLDTMRRVRQAIRSGDFTRFRRDFLEGVGSGVEWHPSRRVEAARAPRSRSRPRRRARSHSRVNNFGSTYNPMPILFIFQQQGGGGNFLVAFLPWILIFGVFYFLLIVPQRKRQRALQETIENLKAGDRVVTNGGIIGTITAVRDTTFLSEAAINPSSKSRARPSPVCEEEEKK